MRKIKTLKKNYEFKNVLNKGKYYVGKQITVYITKNKIKENVIGVAVNTKVSKAVKRNHIKRLIRENYYNVKDKLKSGHNIVFVWNKKVNYKLADYHIIKKDMDNIFTSANLIKRDEEEKNEKSNITYFKRI